MADYAPNFTGRYIVKYSVLGKTHTNLWRIERGGGTQALNGVVTKAAAFYNALTNARFVGWTILNAYFIAEDSDIAIPTAAPTVNAGVVAAPANPLSQSIVSTCFLGRSNLGQKARMYVYGLDLGVEVTGAALDDFRVTSSENGAVSNAIAVLNNGTPSLVASDNAFVGWYSYVDTKFNDYWLKRIRG